MAGSRIAGNTAGYTGGGIENTRGTVTLSASTVTANVVGDRELGSQGAGIHNRDGGTVTLDSTSSVTGNTPYDCVGTPC